MGQQILRLWLLVCVALLRRWGIVTVTAMIATVVVGFPSELYSQERVDTNQFVNVQPLPDTTWAIRPIWGWNPGEYSIGAYIAAEPASGGMATMWNFADSLNIGIYEMRSQLQWSSAIDTLLNGARERDSGGWHHRVIFGTDLLSEVGHARQLQLYPFDSAENYYWPSKFLGRSGGVLDSNEEFRDHKNLRMTEQVYSSSNTDTNQIVADHVVYGYDSVLQTQRWPCIGCDHYTFENHSAFVLDGGDISFNAEALFVVVSGHLFNGGTAFDSDTLLSIDIVNEIPQGQT